MSTEALAERVDKIDVFAETEPNQKEKIILALKKRGHVVGYMVVFEDSYDWAKSVMRARTRDREPVVVVSRNVLGAPPFSEHMWEELDR